MSAGEAPGPGDRLGSPTSLVIDARVRRSGAAYEMEQALGRSPGVPVRVVAYRRVAERAGLRGTAALRSVFSFTDPLP